jgi:glycosyltransferase involved in cell wall biosynthesis
MQIRLLNMSRFPMISIIMPSFNQGEYIEQSILSILRQDYESIEFILVDGGSKDNTSSIIDRYRSNIDIVIQPGCCIW